VSGCPLAAHLRLRTLNTRGLMGSLVDSRFSGDNFEVLVTGHVIVLDNHSWVGGIGLSGIRRHVDSKVGYFIGLAILEVIHATGSHRTLLTHGKRMVVALAGSVVIIRWLGYLPWHLLHQLGRLRVLLKVIWFFIVVGAVLEVR
jgi:hypothetical protein